MTLKSIPGHYSQHPSFQRFVVTVVDVFSFLKTFDFQLESCGDGKNECSVRFTNQTTGVEISYEMPESPGVSLARLKPNGQFSRDHYALRFILLERYPEFDVREALKQSSSDNGFKPLLQLYADEVKDYAADVLVGDFSVFALLDKHVKAEMRKIAMLRKKKLRR